MGQRARAIWPHANTTSALPGLGAPALPHANRTQDSTGSTYTSRRARRAARDVWCEEHRGQTVWAAAHLCRIILELADVAFRSEPSLGRFPSVSLRDELCPITLRPFAEGANAAFQSLHPCAPLHPWPCRKASAYASGCGALPAMPRPTHSAPRAGMHWVRDEGFQQMWANAREKRAQPLCPLCREPVLFARLWKRR